MLGASGDLAKKKIFPALFALFYEGLLPPNVQFYGRAARAGGGVVVVVVVAAQAGCRLCRSPALQWCGRRTRPPLTPAARCPRARAATRAPR